MSKRRAFALVVGLLLVVTVGAGALVAGWLFYTEAGLAWIMVRAAGFDKGLTLEGVAGTLAGGASVRQIRYAGDDIEVRVSDAHLSVSPLSIVQWTPRIVGLRAAELAVVTKPGEPRGRPPDTLALPTNLRVPDARVARLVVDLGKGPLELTNVRLDYSGGKREHRVHELSLAALGHAVAVRGAIDALPPFALRASVAAVRVDAPRASVYAAIEGKLTDLAIDGGAVSGGARLTATASVQPYAGLPVGSLNARLNGLDLESVLAGLPRTAIEAEAALERTRDVLTGSVRITNTLSGPYDKQRLPLAALRASVSVSSDISSVHVANLVADLGGAGALSGSGTIDRSSARLALHTNALNLAGIHTRMHATRLAGRADLTLGRARQSIDAELAQDQIALRLIAHRTGEAIDVPEFRARARGGEATGQARFSLAAKQPFALEATLNRFDPAAWGNFPGGSINGALNAKGTLAGPAVDAQFVIRDSRWLGAPLAGKGAVSIIGERLRNADVAVMLGGNSLVAQGALGAANDKLAVRFDAPRLSALDKNLQGSARGTASLTGSWRAPSIRFEGSAADFAYKAKGSVKALDAKGVVSTHPQGAFEIDAALRGVVGPQWQLRSATVKVEGTRGAHAALVQAHGERIDFRARARGAWREGEGWSGTIQELVNRGEVPVELANPVQIAVGAQRARAESFELRIVGGQLAVSELNYERGVLVTAGRFSALPLRQIVTLAGGPGDMTGTLRLTGNWSIRSVPQLRGTVVIARESGDVTLGAERTMSLGLQALALNANLVAEGIVFDARVRSAVVNGTAQGRIAPVGSGDSARYTGASPIEVTAEASVARLAPFGSLIDTTMIVDGEAHAKLQGRGTLADPRLTGPLTADRLAIALPAEGIDLKGGTLRASLTPREVRVDSFSIRGGDGMLSASGTLARTGFDEASVDWRAEQFMVLGRPDRRLVVTGKGNAALKSGKLAFTGNVRANEGLFELAQSELPALGDDVVVTGRPYVTADARRNARASVDLRVELSNNVHVRGHGLDVWLSGDVRLQTSARGEIQAIGTVDARRGTFVAYGQRLEIERGHLYFNGPLGNPGLDFLAMRKRQAVEAGVAVTGTLRQPLVRVVSNPALPEGEALSWLVLGRAPNQAGPGQLSALPLATGALMGRAGAPLARALHVDEVGLRGGAAAADQFLTVGKRITERLYIAFEQSLGGTENLLRLEMSLTQRIALRAQTGTTSSLGVFYRYSWD